MGKHTPGPWYVRGRLIEAPSKTVAALSKVTDCEKWRDESTANALLLAAAPELLAALKMLLRATDQMLPGVKYIACQDYAILNDAPIAARAAIAKAEKGE